MSSAFDTPASIGSEFAELKRRIRVLETAARVPTISTDNGFKAARSVLDVTLDDPGAESWDIADSEIEMTTTNTGMFVVFFGAEMWVSAGTGQAVATLIVRDAVTDEEIIDIHTGYGRVLTSSSTPVSVASGGRNWVGRWNHPIKVYLRAVKTSGAYTARIRYPWVVGCPV